MSAVKCNLITAKATGFIFSLFNVTSAGHVTYGMLQYVKCFLHGLTSAPHSSMLSVKSVDLAAVHDVHGFPFWQKLPAFLIVATLIAEVLF